MSAANESRRHPIDDVFSSPPGLARMLTDAQIKEATKKLNLIGGKYRGRAAKYASYELHASDLAERLVYDNEMTGHVELRVISDHVVIEPGATVKLYTQESLNLPPCIWALVMALGQLFSAGLIAGSTYVDPGSNGEIYISLSNPTTRVIKIPVGAPIARVHFSS